MHIMLSNGTTQAGSGPAPSPFIRFRAVQEEPSVLLVDDDPDIAPLVIAALSPFQIRVEAVTCGADYIVMGSHGHTPLYDLLVGTTTHGVLKNARCPVVIVPARPKKTT